MAAVSQAAAALGLKWNRGNVVNLEWFAPDVDWTGSYSGAVILRATGAEVALTITAALGQVEVDGVDVDGTEFTATMSAEDSADIPQGTHRWYAKSGDLTRWTGPVCVLP